MSTVDDFFDRVGEMVKQGKPQGKAVKVSRNDDGSMSAEFVPDPKRTEGAPLHYRCVGCGARGVKLWREWNTMLCFQSLLCKPCSEAEQSEPLGGKYGGDQIGSRMPAVPDLLPDDDDLLPPEYTFWGYTSVPDEGVNWWYSLKGEGRRGRR